MQPRSSLVRLSLRIAFITYSGEPDIAADDLPLASELEKRGLAVRACPWDGAHQEHSDPLTLVIRSPWNYDSAPEHFLLWLESLEKSGHRVINPCAVVRWNIHKRYLLEAAARELPVPRTALLPGSAAERDAVIRGFAHHEYVVLKPAISLSAHHTSRVHCAELIETARRLPFAEREYMIQEFIPDIASGELSFIFFGGQFSHCIRKIPKAGDFRTQEDFGATRVRYEPTREEIDNASRFLALAPQQPVFARVDLVRTASSLLLMEIELIDPTLFLGWAPESVPRLANLIADAAR